VKYPLGAIVGRAYLVPDTFWTDTAESEECAKKTPLHELHNACNDYPSARDQLMPATEQGKPMVA
jgi:hypothetical protein